MRRGNNRRRIHFFLSSVGRISGLLSEVLRDYDIEFWKRCTTKGPNELEKRENRKARPVVETTKFSARVASRHATSSEIFVATSSDGTGKGGTATLFLSLSLSFCWSRSNRRPSKENGDDRGPKSPEQNPSTSKKEDDNTATLTRTPDDNPSCTCIVFPILFFFRLSPHRVSCISSFVLFVPTHYNTISIHEPTITGMTLLYYYLGDESGRETDYSDSSQ